MYESPISVAINSFIKEQTERADNEILYQATMQTGISIDKDELVKALRYDRDQYDKGYSDGIQAFAERLVEGRLAAVLLQDDTTEYAEGYYDALLWVEGQCWSLVKEMVKGGEG
jgi:hypothetical protein